MKFEIIQIPNTPTVKVVFEYSKLSMAAITKFNHLLLKLGGEQKITEEVYWQFPNFITEVVLKEVIHNTCFKCGGIMTEGVALENTYTSSEDFGGDKGNYGTTMSKNGPAVMVKVRKCADCGHSHS